MGHGTRLAPGSEHQRSRAFLYGESVFTTLRVEDGQIYFGDAHRQRLIQGAEWLWPGTASQVEKLWPFEPPGATGVWRLTLSAEALTRGVRLHDEPKLMLDDWWSEGLPKEERLVVRTTAAPARSSDWPSFLKSGDYLSRLVAARRLSAQEVPLFFVQDVVCELMHANFFAWDNDILVTPLTGPNVLAGVGRDRLLAVARGLGVKVVERDIKIDELSNFKQLWAINAVRGISEFESIDGRSVLGHPLRDEFQRAFFGRVK